MKTIIVAMINADTILSPGNEGVEIETCYRDGSPIYRGKLKDELSLFEGKRVIITIESM